MSHGDCWEAVCAHCGRVCSHDRRWQLEEPTDTPSHAKDCCEAVCFGGAAPVAKWEHSFIVKVRPLGRVSGFSTSESDFTPHHNRAFGKRVGSLSEMKALQEQHGTSDMVVEGDGADRHAPRDLQRRLKRHREVHEAMETGGSITRDGVTVEFTEE